MTILAKSAIIERLQAGNLTVSPLLTKPNLDESSQVGAASIDLRMGNVVLMARARGSSHVDPRSTISNSGEHKDELERRQKHERYELTYKMKLLLHPGALALVPTLEWVKLPHDLMGMVTARSTWAREGLSIATATLIEPGYEGIVTLELVNLGQIPITLYPGLKLAQIAFAKIEQAGDPTKGGTQTATSGGDHQSPKSQFNLSFEPRQGELAKPSEQPFLPEIH